VVPKDTEINFVLLESVSSATATKGQLIRMAVEEDVVIHGVVAIPKGTLATGVVSNVRKAKLGIKDGRLEVRPIAMTIANGVEAKLKENRTGEDACGDFGPCWAMYIFFAPAVPFALIGLAANAIDGGDRKKKGTTTSSLPVLLATPRSPTRRTN
jgi:hypothetical protein